jgi:tetratricopeptide (TPR) repeat protein
MTSKLALWELMLLNCTFIVPLVLVFMTACTNLPFQKDYQHQLFLKYLMFGRRAEGVLDYQTAESMYIEALTHAKAAGKPLEIARAETCLAQIYSLEGRPQLASEKYSDALATCQAKGYKLNKEDADASEALMAEVAIDLGGLYHSEGQLENAAQFLKQGVEICERRTNRPPDFQEIYVDGLQKYAQVLHEQGDLTNATLIRKKGVEAARSAFQSLAVRQALARDNSASAATGDQGYISSDSTTQEKPNRFAELDEADRKWLNLTMKGRELLGKNNVEGAQEQFEEAQKLAERYNLQQRVAMSMNDVAMVLIHRRKFAEAEKLCKRMIRIGRQAFGEDHAFTAIEHMALGEVYFAAGRYNEAADAYKEAMKIAGIRNRPGEQLFNLTAAKYVLALKKLGKLEEASAIEAWISPQATPHRSPKNDAKEPDQW